ncbi:uncharacterized protein LOC131893280 [Tigriopus californicus]|uniref:uncharacterized protein LOC131893280 n=1 Tax=Tigriopus californicus TaxID=6832 RepID=UPI0027DA713B|nr:uncharacterized protein LOC131893280 [Tigriopus californicus]
MSQNNTNWELLDALNKCNCGFISLTWFVVIQVCGNILLLSIIWCQQFGRSNNRTLLNHLVSHYAGYVIVSNLVSCSSNMALFWFEFPYPHLWCLMQELVANHLLMVGVLTSLEGLLLRCLYLFYWKNVGKLNDDFFSAYLFVVNNVVALYFSLIFAVGSDLYQAYYYICTATHLQHGQSAIPYLRVNFFLVTLTFHICCFIWSFIRKRKLDRHEGNDRFTTGRSSSSLMSFGTAMLIFFIFASSTLPYVYLSQSQSRIVESPKTLIFSLALPQFTVSVIIPVLTYIRNPSMAVIVWRHFKDQAPLLQFRTMILSRESLQ